MKSYVKFSTMVFQDTSIIPLKTEKNHMIAKLAEIYRTFLGMEDRSDLARRTGILALAVLLYRQLDWILVALTASLVGVLRYYQVSHLHIFLILWIANLFLSGALVVCSQKVEVDFTLSNGWRRLVNRAAARSRLLGGILEAAFILGISLWAGAGPLYIFLCEKIPSRPTLGVIVVVVSGIQMAIWGGVFVFGYESLSALVAACLKDG